MKILIDADGCPVLDITIDIAKKNGLETIILCDTSHIINKEGVETITVSKGSDSVDFSLLKLVKKGDLVVTQDYGLAGMVLAKGGLAIRQDGLVYSDFNIDRLLEERHNAKKLRKSGARAKGPRKRTADDDKRYTDELKKLLGDTSEK
jgi:hypothetical protein